jgi:hypothetical protein
VKAAVNRRETAAWSPDAVQDKGIEPGGIQMSVVTIHRLFVAGAIALVLPVSAFASVRDGRSPDTLEAATAAHAVAVSIDGRSPDTRDAAFVAHAFLPSTVSGSRGGFDWTDAGIGALGGFAIASVLTGGIFLAQRGSRSKLAA